MARKAKASEDKIVKDVIKKFGPTIDLKKSPHVLIEILRSHGRLLDEPGDGGSAPGGAPPSGPASRRVDNETILAEVLKLGRQIKALQKQ